ncbi:sigma-70 family RNA polymerase sigma factor [Paenibacillus alba]|uniref:sigma-70 family RNA polymerase sigma factor n=1 Tax=Paenibacillus alba TaxID=1197127 RepID=UPI0015659BDA|nr:sigma-70 family RNA polymerase sigma factor [Paenibacillus alba]
MGETEEASDLEDLEYIRAVIAGHRESYAELVLRYQGMVYRVCLKMTDDRFSAEDLAQEVFIQAYRALPSYREQSSFSTWLYQITVRKCLDWRRSRARDRLHRSDANLTEQDTVTWQTPEHELLDKERNEKLHRMIEELQEPYQTVVRLYYLQYCSYQDIANRTQLPIKTVESQLYRARRIMRERGEGL